VTDKTIKDARWILRMCAKQEHSNVLAQDIPCIGCCACCSVPATLIWVFPALKAEWEKMQEGK
jgi:hypothetical protein